MENKKLLPKQKAFCEHYATNGNATESARLAGYSENSAEAIGLENLGKLGIQEYIAELANPIENKRIANANEIKEFWSSVMRENVEKMNDRLKASELLAKSGGMFIERVEIQETSMTDILKDLVNKLPD
jgi:phage terminase small subunit